MIICAGKSERFDFALPIGVGLINAAISLTQLCILNRPKQLIFIGTAGSYANYDLLEIVTSQGAANIELSLLLGKSYTPIDNVIISKGSIVKNQTIVNSSNYISTDSVLAQEMKKHNVGLENMEFFSVLSVAQEFGIPAGGVFCVTNRVSPEAHNEYDKHHLAALDKLDSYAKEQILPRLASEL
ncbi:purine-nucleoside phosphorylase [Campylobacterota bacterium]|nr:purine-nucleoside phosphorylase [Campylobacterota bacterium]